MQSNKTAQLNLMYSVIAAGVTYACYINSQLFVFRILSFLCALTFYLLSTLILLKPHEFGNQHQISTSRKLLRLYVGLVAVNILFSFPSSASEILTLFFHPYAFLAFYIAIAALIADTKTASILLQVTKQINSYFAIILIMDLVIFNEPVIISELCIFLVLELLLNKKISKKRLFYIVTLVVVCVYIENLFINRTFALRLALIPSLLAISKLVRFAENKLTKLAALGLSIVALYLLLFSFQSTFDLLSRMIGKTETLNRVDTRSFLFTEFFMDFKSTDWGIGRGYLGEYFSQWFRDWEGDRGDAELRFTIEVGILEVLLKGGLVLLIPFLVLILWAIISGFVNHKSGTLAFNLSLFLLVQFILLGIENVPAFNTNFFLIWIITGIILSKKDSQILFEKYHGKFDRTRSHLP
ncbi:hypothetical protein ACWKW6_30325 [Dyadobacter jiangsuensis]